MITEEIAYRRESRYFKGDPVIWYIVVALSVISILVVYSATQSLAYKQSLNNPEKYLIKHTSLVVLALVVMWIAHRIDYRFYARLSLLALYLSVPLLLITLVFGPTINEATRWLTIPLIEQSFQPSDLAKLALIAHLAAMLSKRQQNIESVKESLFPMLVWIGVICGLIAISNFSNAAMLFATSLLIMFIGRVPIRYFLILLVIGGLSISFALVEGQRFETAVSRWEAYKKSLYDSDNAHPQAQESYMAIASGGITGKGPGNSDQRNFLPHPYSDFIFAIIVEEYGLLGGALVVFLYLALLYRAMMIMAQSNRAFGGILAAGLAFSLVIQAMIHMSVAVGLVPITGLPLPLLSMGGTSLLFTGISIGVILSVSRGDIIE
ncbi:MAG: FtsW/RodA/SpoVE family cell cycle protein [Thermonemataceae bacterium]